MQTFGKRSVDLLEDAGWLSHRTWVAHGVHFNADEIGRLGRAGVGVSHLAAADMAFGVGICPTKDLEAAGVARQPRRRWLGLERLLEPHGGGAPCADAATRCATATPPSAPTTRCAGRRKGGARCLGRDDIGRIGAGLQADLALYRLDEPRFSGAQDPIAALVLCGAHAADRVMVAGSWRVIDGRPEGVDLEALVAKHKAAAKAFA